MLCTSHQLEYCYFVQVKIFIACAYKSCEVILVKRDCCNLLEVTTLIRVDNNSYVSNIADKSPRCNPTDTRINIC